MANAFDEADQGAFLRSEKDDRPYWETQHRAFLAPLVMSGYNNSVSYGVPSMLGGSAWGFLDDVLRGRSVAKGEVEAAAGDAANGAMTGAFAAPKPTNAVGSAGGRLFHGSPRQDLTQIAPSERGPLGPGVYTSPGEHVANRYAGPEGKLYQVPDEAIDVFNGAGHRTDAQWFGHKDDVERLKAALTPDERAKVGDFIDKMWSSDGYPLYQRMRIALGGSDEAAQAVFKRAGFKGLSGQVDGPETLLFDSVNLFANPKQASAAASAEHIAKTAGREVDPLGFYSQALETAKTLPQTKASIEQYLGAMRNKGVKQAEIDATNIANAFEPGKPVTRDELVDMLRKNRVELREKRYAGSDAENNLGIVGRPWNEDGVIAQTVEINDRQWTAYHDPDAGNAWAVGPDGQTIPGTGRMNSQNMRSAYDAIQAHEAKAGVPDFAAGPAQYAHHSLDEFNPTYSEDVLHMPPNRDYAVGRQKFEAKYPGKSWDELRQADKDYFANLGTDYRKGHFDDPNIVGHTQNSLGELPDGRKVSIWDQVQSDWGQRLRKGALDPAKVADLEAQLSAARAAASAHIDGGAGILGSKLDLSSPNNITAMIATIKNMASGTLERAGDPNAFQWVKRHNELQNDYRRVMAELEVAKNAAPAHPLVNTTDQWVNTLLRRTLRNSIDRGADAIAIPHGETVLSYNPGDDVGMMMFYGQRPNRRAAAVMRGNGETGKLADIAENGTEGIVPKNLRSILAKLDSDGVRRQFLDKLMTPSGMRGNGFTVYDITPKMREEALKGLPLFSRGIPVPVPPPAPAPYDPTIY